MDCRTFALLLDRPEKEWTAEELLSARDHAAQCAQCRMLWKMRREMAVMDREETLPPSFSESWINMIRTEAEKKMSDRFANIRRPLAAVAAIAVLAVGTAVSYHDNWGDPYPSSRAYRSSSEYGTVNNAYSLDAGASAKHAANAPAVMAAGVADYAMEDYAPYETEEAVYGSGEISAQTAARIIRTISFTLKTRQYDRDYQQIRDLTEKSGGRIESLSISGDGSASSLRRAEFTLRIPSEHLDSFVGGARNTGSISSYSESSDDVSDSYFDVQSRLQTQQAKLARLTEMMDKADSMEDLIQLEGAISETQYLIDRYSGQLGSYDSRIRESTVYVTLRELSSADAAEIKELSLGERIVNALKASLETAGDVSQAFVIFILSALPWIAAAALILLIVRYVVKKRKKHREA